MSTTFAPLSNRPFRNIWAAGTASNLGSVIQATSAAWLMTTMTTSPVLIALVQTAATIPLVLCALPAGAAADLYNKRLQMLFGNVLSLAAIILLVVLTVQDEITPYRLLALTGIASVGLTVMLPAWHASVIEMVTRADLAASVSLNSLGFNIARAVGPAIGAEIIAIAGIAAAFSANAVSYLFMIAALLVWRYKPIRKTLPQESIGRAMVDGLRFVGLSPGLRLHIARGFLLTFTASALLALPPVVALELDVGARGFGILLTAFGVGAMVGSLSVASVRLHMQPKRQLLFAMLCLAVSSIALAASPNLFFAAFSLLIGGFGWIQSASTLQVTVQTACPRWVTARTISIFSTTFALGIASGAALWGLLAAEFGMTTALIGSGMVTAGAAIFSSLVHFYDPNEDDLQPRFELDSYRAPQVDPRSGPVWLTVEYRVPKANVTQFRSAMRDYARIRRRDGARNWSLAQDIDSRDIWIERFQSPTWADFLHRISRMLVADNVTRERILALCEDKPVWRRQLERSGRARELSDGRDEDEGEVGSFFRSMT
ncbi:MFS transporter [Parasphingopyxis algicola]|nr:MFS transporter [Parasphingopyxis algicola]